MGQGAASRHASSLIAKLKGKALEGDILALRLCIDKALPNYRPTYEPVKIPELFEADTLFGKANAILSAVATGKLAPDIGAQLINAVGVAARVDEITILKDRLEALEKAMTRGKP